MEKQQRPVLVPVVLILAVLLTALALWRFLPRKLSSLLPEGAQTVAASATVSGALPSAGIRQYEMQALPADSAEGREILDRLAQMKVRPGLRNLLPWPPKSYTETGSLDTGAVFLFYGGEGESFAYMLSFYSGGTVALQKPGKAGIWVYRGTDTQAEQFIAWVAAHGTQK